METASGSGSIFDNAGALIFYGLIFAGIAAWRYWVRRQAAQVHVAGPMLLSIYAPNANLQSLHSGQTGIYTYSLMMSSAPELKTDDSGYTATQYNYQTDNTVSPEPFSLITKSGVMQTGKSRIILHVDLPSASLVHLAALGKNSGSKGVDPTMLINNQMVEVKLEGNFPDYFKLYCDESHQTELRQVLDPVTMQLLIDFGSEYEWEVYQGSLYVVERDFGAKNNGQDNTTMIEDTDSFLQRLQRTLDQFKLETV